MIMSAASRAYTPSEAAAVSEVAVKSVHNAIDKRIVSSRNSGRGERSLSDNDLLRLKLWYGVGSILSAERRKRLFDDIDRNPDAATVRADDYLIIDVARAREQLAERARALLEAEGIIEINKAILGGEPVFRNTRIPVRLIAAMTAQGVAREDILEGYPALDSRMVELAEIWTAAHPARGRPRTLAELGVPPKSEMRITLPRKSETKPSGNNP
jgi:uncharacterized protein (DUF433 family)